MFATFVEKHRLCFVHKMLYLLRNIVLHPKPINRFWQLFCMTNANASNPANDFPHMCTRVDKHTAKLHPAI